MQGYSYSIFSSFAIAIHLIINFNMLAGRGIETERGRRYRGFLFGVLVYYVADAAWGVVAGLGWTRLLYAETILFFLSLPVFVFMWGRFVAAYLRLGRLSSQILSWSGYALLAFNVVMLAANFFNGCIFSFDEHGKYLFGDKRYLTFALLVAFNALTAVFALAKAFGSRDSDRRRSMMVLMFFVTVTAAMFMQIVWPLTPFTSLGCLVGNCFFNVFVVQDEQSAKHTDELEKALERARAAEKSRSMFFSIVSHDIRTPLNAILGYSELLQSGVASKAEKDEALESIRASGTTLLQLVNDVLDLAKMDAGKMALTPGSLRLDQLTDEVFASFKMAASEKGIALVNRTAGVPTVMLDGHRFRQILFNLVGNAVKFTSRGSVVVAASYGDKGLEVSVSDTGCGIPPDMLTHILDPFVQVLDPRHAADRAGGTGLGLAICRSLVEVMGGRLVVESEPGRGSKFSIVVPGVKLAEEKCKAESAEAGSGGVNSPTHPLATHNSPRHVLVVDDSPVNRSVLTAFLRKAGVASVEQACDGEEALSLLNSARNAGRPHDFVFSDFWMPNMNGLELIERIRADARFGGLPVFAVTADTEFHHDNRSELFDGILLKPLTYAKLLDAFAKVHSKSHNSEENQANKT